MSLIKTEAIITKNFALNNEDVIITTFTPFLGKLQFSARKGKVSRKRFLGALDIINKVEIEFNDNSNKEIQKITNVEIIDQYDVIRKNYNKIMLASYFIDLINHFHPDRMKAENSYKLLSMTLTYMNTEAPLGSILFAFQTKLLCACGLRPNFEQEVIKNLPNNSRDFISLIINSPIKDFLGINFNDKTEEKILKAFLDSEIDYHLGKHLKSRDFLKNV